MQYYLQYFRGTNFRGIDFLVLLRVIFLQVLILTYFTPKVTVTRIFLINTNPSVRWHLLEGDSGWPIKNETLAQVLSCDFCKIFENSFFKGGCFCTLRNIRLNYSIVF